MTNLVTIDSLRKLFFSKVIVSTTLLLSACMGGGLGGSGDGGVNDKELVMPPDDSISSTYKFNHVPERLLAKFPASLAQRNGMTEPSDATPFNKLTATTRFIVDQKLEIGLLLLSLEANWASIKAHCQTTPDDTPCDLSTAGLSANYSAEMEAWLYDLLVAIEKERSGTLDTLPKQTLKTIQEKITTETNNPLFIRNGLFTSLSPGHEYRYEAVIIARTGTSASSVNRAFTVRWADDRTLSFMSLAMVEGEKIVNLQSSFDAQASANGISNAILLTTKDADLRLERQLNLHQPDSNKNLQIESQLTEYKNSSKVDFYSIGNATDTGGYLSSEHSLFNAMEMRSSDFVRESFTQDAEIEARSVCKENQSERLCDLNNAWEHYNQSPPMLSQFFLTPEQLDALKARLTPFDLRIDGIDPTADTLVLIKSENLMVSFTSDGLVLDMPGLGSFDLSSYSMNQAIDGVADNPQLLSAYSDRVLCRVNKTNIHETQPFHSFCAGSVQEIENAIVISETFVDGKPGVEWQFNASVHVIEQ